VVENLAVEPSSSSKSWFINQWKLLKLVRVFAQEKNQRWTAKAIQAGLEYNIAIGAQTLPPSGVLTAKS